MISDSPTISSNLPIGDSRVVVRILEIQRLSVVFFRSLLFEGSGISSKGSNSTDDPCQLNGFSEIPVIPRSLITNLAHQLELISETVGGVVSGVAKCLDVQRNLLQISASYRLTNSSKSLRSSDLLRSIVSPIVMRSAFDFFADFIRYASGYFASYSTLRAYAGADVSLYENADIAANIRVICGASPRFSYLAGIFLNIYFVIKLESCQPTAFTTLVCGMVSCLVECVHQMSSEDLLCLAAIRLLKNVALFLSNEDVFLLVCSKDTTICNLWSLFTGGNSYQQWSNSLSPVVLTSLWEAVSSLTVRLVSSATINMVTPTGQSAAWIYESNLTILEQVPAIPLPC